MRLGAGHWIGPVLVPGGSFHWMVVDPVGMPLRVVLETQADDGRLAGRERLVAGYELGLGIVGANRGRN